MDVPKEKLTWMYGLPIKCNACGEKLQSPGALMFSPPLRDSGNVEKFHICLTCWFKLKDFVNFK